MNRDFVRAFIAANPHVVVTDAAVSARTLSDASLVERYGAFLQRYTITGIPNPQLLADMGSALHVDAIIQGEVIEIVQRHELLDVQDGETLVTIRYRMTGTRTASILWEGTGHAAAGKKELVRRVPPLSELIATAEQEVIKVVPKLAN
jgi:hypothetical protein